MTRLPSRERSQAIERKECIFCDQPYGTPHTQDCEAGFGMGKPGGPVVGATNSTTRRYVRLDDVVELLRNIDPTLSLDHDEVADLIETEFV